MMTCTVPSTRPEYINNIVESIDRYNIENLDQLEEYVVDQCENRHYDLQANLALLKLYQFYPSNTKYDMIAFVLGKSLCSMPSPDFNLCLYLLNETVLEDPSIASMIKLYTFLDECKFEEFWKSVHSAETKKYVKGIDGLDEDVRKYIIHLISSSHQTILISLLSRFLNIPEKQLPSFIKNEGWTVSNKTVQIPLNKQNDIKGVVVQENIQFAQLNKIITNSRVI